MKSRYSEKKVNELAEKASALGYQLVNLSERATTAELEH